ncbi:hypothetical protein AAFG07_32735 [Bradyrhizobium sp. B097]|uniref:hypothetical protein n=1 Tax=Bradyrhizobium sp. B097 TaxID=3140244 RepID=UPI003183257E
MISFWHLWMIRQKFEVKGAPSARCYHAQHNVRPQLPYLLARADHAVLVVEIPAEGERAQVLFHHCTAYHISYSERLAARTELPGHSLAY